MDVFASGFVDGKGDNRFPNY